MDQKILFLINREWTNSVLDSFMATMSSASAWVPVFVALALLTVVRAGFRGRAALLMIGLVVAVNNSFLCDPIKKTVGRARPREAMADVRVVDLQKATPQMLAVVQPADVRITPPGTSAVRGHSFPSGHTVNNFSAATVLIYFYRRRGALYLIPASLVAYSRIYVGAHWPSDVLVSIFVAVGVTLIEIALAEWAWKKYGARFAAGLHARHPALAGGAAA